jgi:hypothetical protein
VLLATWVQDPAGADTAARPVQAVPRGLVGVTVTTQDTPWLPPVAATESEASSPVRASKAV